MKVIIASDPRVSEPESRPRRQAEGGRRWLLRFFHTVSSCGIIFRISAPPSLGCPMFQIRWHAEGNCAYASSPTWPREKLGGLPLLYTSKMSPRDSHDSSTSTAPQHTWPRKILLEGRDLSTSSRRPGLCGQLSKPDSNNMTEPGFSNPPLSAFSASSPLLPYPSHLPRRRNPASSSGCAGARLP